MKIWVDDIRPAPEGWHWWTSSEMALFYLDQWKMLVAENMIDAPQIMSLDHDLGGDDTTRPIVIWMIENDFWPVEVRVHSANSVGYEWLTAMIDRYKPTEKD